METTCDKRGACRFAQGEPQTVTPICVSISPVGCSVITTGLRGVSHWLLSQQGAGQGGCGTPLWLEPGAQALAAGATGWGGGCPHQA